MLRLPAPRIRISDSNTRSWTLADFPVIPPKPRVTAIRIGFAQLPTPRPRVTAIRSGQTPLPRQPNMLFGQTQGRSTTPNHQVKRNMQSPRRLERAIIYTCVLVCVCAYVCIQACMHACPSACTCTCTCTWIRIPCTCMCIPRSPATVWQSCGREALPTLAKALLQVVHGAQEALELATAQDQHFHLDQSSAFPPWGFSKLRKRIYPPANNMEADTGCQVPC